MLPKDSMANTFLVSIVLCIVCSLLVSTAAVALKPRQERNKVLDQQRNIIAAAGLAEDPRALSSKEVLQLFQQRIERKLVDLQTGQFVEDADEDYDPLKAAKDPQQRVPIDSEFDIGLRFREPKTWVYLVKDEQGELEQIVLPIYGMGLWSVLYGYISVDKDLRTIRGITFYEHGETPGLGGEVENPVWRAKWVGKQIWEEGQPRTDEFLRIGVAKGSPPPQLQPYQVDGLSGATITSRGVSTMLKYWFSSDGFGPFINNLANQQGATDGSSQS
ncbi:MAG: Na(+)-translocating NADH-quinone reductase subunit C [Pirellulaceae bacterium]|nr:MAG: Na(+)-translocating NADH-quinone reductase subunit C [Pirellulaceae bacterium]